MQAKAHADGDIDRGNRAFFNVERVEQEEVAAMLLQPVADLHDPAIAFGRVLAARDEAWLLK